MVRVLLGLALIVAVVAGLGFYTGWFPFSSGSNDNEEMRVRRVRRTDAPPREWFHCCSRGSVL